MVMTCFQKLDVSRSTYSSAMHRVAPKPAMKIRLQPPKPSIIRITVGSLMACRVFLTLSDSKRMSFCNCLAPAREVSSAMEISPYGFSCSLIAAWMVFLKAA